MATQTKKSSSPKRRQASSKAGTRSPNGRASQQRRSASKKRSARTTASKSTSGSASKASAAARSRSRPANGAGPVHEATDAIRSLGSKAKAPAVAGVATAVGLVGGAVLGNRLSRKPRRVLGVPIPGTGQGMDGLVKQVGKTGKQVGQLAQEVRAARKKAEQVADALS